MLKSLLPSTLFGRALLIIVAPIVLLQLVVIVIFFDRHWDIMTERMARGVVGDVAMVIEALGPTPTDDEIARLSDMALRNMQLDLHLAAGAELTVTTPAWRLGVPRWALSKELANHLGHPHRLDTSGAPDFIEISVEVPSGLLTVKVPVSRLTASTSHILLLWMIGSSVILLAIAIIFLRNQVRPILKLAEAAEDFGKGRMTERFKPTGAREIRQAAAQFMDMRDRIVRHLQQRTEMLAGVSHDLRTPLTRIKLELEMLGTGEEVDNLRADVVEMEQMLKEYLDFARGQDQEDPVTTDLGNLLQEVTSDARREGRDVELSIDGNMILPLRRDSFKRCLTNLVSNALRFGTRVRISAVRRSDSIEIAVDDDGPGIAESDREDVFRPFLRLEQSRNQDTGGVGLGLSIARDAARSHGGDIVLSTAPLGGLRALVHMPV
jgi:two-component system, OmpR family, osmolarity sensor histidine kinase EnvZ